MKKIRPFGVVFLVMQCVILLAVLFIPGHMAYVLDPGMGGLFWMMLFLLAALGVLFVDAIWVAVVLRRYHARHREVSPVRALAAWGIYLFLAVVVGPCVNFLVFAGEAPPLTLSQWVIFFLLYLIPTLIPAEILWLPAFLLSVLDPHYRYRPKQSKPQA